MPKLADRSKEPSTEFLRDLYITQGLEGKEVAKVIGLSISRTYSMLGRHGLTTKRDGEKEAKPKDTSVMRNPSENISQKYLGMVL